jgi:glycosyltransferase involved in cell wall biosynthesis
MKNPTVSFVVPCYKLAHLLPECINSILSQSFSDFEVLIMDDCSPDNTAEVAQSFQDPRVKHIRNDLNLGHLRNYNKGIGLARGKYVWLISADDYLLRDYILQKYVDLLDQRPNVGYTFCPAVSSGSSIDNKFKDWVSFGQSIHGKNDRIFKGLTLLKKLLRGNTIVAASGLVRRECYEKISLFPLDMPWAGDWYLWCLFALNFDVGYFAEPMVCYREHELSMTTKLLQKEIEACFEEEVVIRWAIKRNADALGFQNVSKHCLKAIAQIYASRLVSECYEMSKPSSSIEQFKSSLLENTESEKERNWVWARVFEEIANGYYWQGQRFLAKKFYNNALKMDPLMISVYGKKFLLSIGNPGDYIWKWLKWIKVHTRQVATRKWTPNR